MRILPIALLALLFGACVTSEPEAEVTSALNAGCNFAALRSDNSNGGAVAAAYCAVLDRPADNGGFAFQLQVLNSGVSRFDLLVSFFRSAEFQAPTQAMQNTDFVTLLYRRLLLREPDPAGLAFQLQALANGATREAIFRGFIGSPEFHSLWLVLP
jgi:hypothetical protein